MTRRSFLRFAALVAVYLVAAVPFKAMNLIPGFTDIRPVEALGPVYGIFFGLPGCFASGFGNLAADALAAELRWTSIAGFASHFVGSLLAWLFWTRVSRTPFSLRTPVDLLRYVLVVVAIAAAEDAIITPAVVLLYPDVDWTFFAGAVFCNTAGFPIFLGIPLSILLQEEMGLQPADPRLQDPPPEPR